MRKKRNIKFRAVDFLIILICLTGSILSGAAFWNEYNRTLTKLNEEPIGTITFKKRTAQRKFIDRVVWDRLKESSPLYNGDTIRTIEFSEALITFKDGVTRLSLMENTLIQIFYDETDGIRIDLQGGNLEVNSSTGNVTVTAGTQEILVDGHVNFNMNDEGFSIAVLSGEAVFDGERIETGMLVAINENGERNNNPAVIMQSFGSSVRLNAPQGEEIPVEFFWTTQDFTPDTSVIIEVSLNRDFSRIIHETEVTDSFACTIPLESGNYWWRVYPVNESSGGMPVNNMYPSGTMEIIPIAALEIPQPVSEQEPEPELEPEPEPELPPAPVIVQTPTPAPRPQPVPTPPPAPPPATPPQEPDPPPQQQEPDPPPAPSIESLRQVTGTGTITNAFPTDNYILYADQIQNAPAIYFSWEGTSTGYEFALYNENGDIVIPRTAAVNTTGRTIELRSSTEASFVLENPHILTPGNYIWHIYERGRRREVSELPDFASGFTVSARQAPLRTLPTLVPGELYGQ